jgi:hypothetical protein
MLGIGKAATGQVDVPHGKLNILVLYSPYALFTSTVFDHVSAFGNFSRHNIFYAVGVDNAPCFYDMAIFDVIIVHYSVRLALPQHISPHVVDAIRSSSAYKILFIQDEYEGTETARKWIATLGIDMIFTCIPNSQADQIYPLDRFRRLKLVENFTGYVSPELEKLRGLKPLRDRPIVIGYRGRPLPFRYGHLARDKYYIGLKMREICRQRGIPHDIEMDEDKRIYGSAWYDFLRNCRAVLSTESGSNIFDEEGKIAATVDLALRDNPWLSYEEVHQRILAEHETRIKMNQISPRVFEAAATKSALILFEGEYSGVVQPIKHYIPLCRDFSNIDEVHARLEDVDALQEMVERTYQDLILSRKYSYEAFIRRVDENIEKQVKRSKGTHVTKGNWGALPKTSEDDVWKHFYIGSVTSRPHSHEEFVPAPDELTNAFAALQIVPLAPVMYSDQVALTPTKVLLGLIVRRYWRKVYCSLPGWGQRAVDSFLGRHNPRITP